MNATLKTLQALTEVPMQGDPEPRPDAPYRGIDRELKNRVRDQNLQVVGHYFSNVQPSGQFGVAFTHRGMNYVLRMTSHLVIWPLWWRALQLNTCGNEPSLSIYTAAAADAEAVSRGHDAGCGASSSRS